jgi:hypothetical protein
VFLATADIIDNVRIDDIMEKVNVIRLTYTYNHV